MAKPMFQPIRPKGRVMPRVSIAGVGAALVKFAVSVIGRQMRYPPQKPGSRYRRTGEYGRRWTMRGPSTEKMGLAVQVGSNLAYAPYVGGLKKRRPRQTMSAAKAGWTSVEEVGQDEWKKTRPAVIRALQGR